MLSASADSLPEDDLSLRIAEDNHSSARIFERFDPDTSQEM
jgi:hypothetical protein